jgi:hypothetical protein
MDLIISTLKLMLIILVVKQPPPPPTPKADFDKDRQLGANIVRKEAEERAEQARQAWREQLFGLPPLTGRVYLAIDESLSMSIDGVAPIAGTITASILLNQTGITDLHVTFFAGKVEKVRSWTKLDAPNGLSGNEQAKLAERIARDFCAPPEVAAQLATGQRLQILEQVLGRLQHTKPATNLVGAITQAVDDCQRLPDEGKPATIVLITDGMHCVVLPDGSREPEDIHGVQNLLAKRLAALPKSTSPRPVLHAVLLLGEPTWTGMRNNRKNYKVLPAATEITTFLRSVTGQFDGRLLALPAPRTVPATGMARMVKDPLPKSGPASNAGSNDNDGELRLPFYRHDARP